MKMKDVPFVLGLKKNLLSVSTLDAKGIIFAFIDGQVIMWPKGNTIDDVVVIGEQEAGIYRLKGQPKQALVHDSMHYRALPLVSKVVEGILEIQEKHEGVCKGCAKAKNTKKTFPSSESKAKEILAPMYAV